LEQLPLFLLAPDKDFKIRTISWQASWRNFVYVNVWKQRKEGEKKIGTEKEMDILYIYIQSLFRHGVGSWALGHICVTLSSLAFKDMRNGVMLSQ